MIDFKRFANWQERLSIEYNYPREVCYNHTLVLANIYQLMQDGGVQNLEYTSKYEEGSVWSLSFKIQELNPTVVEKQQEPHEEWKVAFEGIKNQLNSLDAESAIQTMTNVLWEHTTEKERGITKWNLPGFVAEWQLENLESRRTIGKILEMV